MRLLSLDVLPEPAYLCRKWCERCQQSFTLMPNDVLPFHSYGVAFIGDRLIECVEGASLRSRDFYERKGLVFSAGPKTETSEGPSWSDQLEMEPLTPSHQLFHRWRKVFSWRARRWLQWLLVACVMSGCDLRTRLGESLETFGRCPENLYPLLLSAGLVGLLQEKPVRSCMEATLQLICGSSVGSHNRLRAPGRSPPYYGGDLEFPSSGHR